MLKYKGAFIPHDKMAGKQKNHTPKQNQWILDPHATFLLQKCTELFRNTHHEKSINLSLRSIWLSTGASGLESVSAVADLMRSLGKTDKSSAKKVGELFSEIASITKDPEIVMLVSKRVALRYKHDPKRAIDETEYLRNRIKYAKEGLKRSLMLIPYNADFTTAAKLRR